MDKVPFKVVSVIASSLWGNILCKKKKKKNMHFCSESLFQPLKYNYLVSKGMPTNYWYSYQQMVECRAATVFLCHKTMSAHRLSKHYSQTRKLIRIRSSILLLFEHDCVTIRQAEPNPSQFMQHRGRSAEWGWRPEARNHCWQCVFSAAYWAI